MSTQALRAGAAACVAIAALGITPMAGIAAQRQPVDEILAGNPGLTVAELDRSLHVSGASKHDKDAAYAQVLSEMRAAQSSTGVSAAASGGGGDAQVSLGVADRQGDIFWSPAGTLFINYNHVGLYYHTDKTAEAPGTGQVTQIFDARTRKVTKGAQKKYLFRFTASQRLDAANWAGKHLGREYNVNFVGNKDVETDKYNCSQFVWAAYKKYVDLDSNGGFGVYPNDVTAASVLRWYATV